jgi:hypothetical protein
MLVSLLRQSTITNHACEKEIENESHNGERLCSNVATRGFLQQGSNEKSGRTRTLAKGLEFLNEPGIYVLYRNDQPYYVGQAKKLRQRLHLWATTTSSRNFHFWNFFSAFAVIDKRKRDELEGVLIASLPLANNGAKPRLKRVPIPEEVKALLRTAYSGKS